MNALSRRALLGLSAPHHARETWSFVACLRDCDPGSARPVVVDGVALRVESLGEGVRVVDAARVGRALELRDDGKLFVCTSAPWPRTRVISHATGEPCDFDELD